jgi:ssDNA-binding replication factor A large subunit
MGPMVHAMVVMVVVSMMRRVRQCDVCEKHQRDGQSDNLTHDSIL